MKKILIASSLLLALTAASAASAAEFGTTYAEVGYAKIDNDYSGYNGKGSIGFGSTGVYAFGDHTNYKIEGVHLKQTTLGLGYQHNVGANVALFGEGGYYRIDLAGENVNGYAASVGGRIAAGQYVEPFVKVTRTHVSDLGNATDTTAGVLIKPWQHVGFIAQYTFGNSDNADQWKAGVRYTF